MVLTGAQVIMECLLEQGVDTVFGYPGGAVLNIYDALYEYRDRINHIRTAHEQGAAHAADGYARSSGKTGVCIATSGPGATNLVTHCNRIYGLRPGGGHHRQCQFGPAGLGQLPRGRHHRHYDADHEAQFLGEGCP